MQSTLPALWESHNQICKSCELAVKKSGGRPKKKRSTGRPKITLTVDDMMKLDSVKQIPPSLEKASCHIINLKVNNSTLPNNSIQISTGGPPPLTVSPIAAARKESQEVTKRTLRLRTRQSKEVLQ